MNGFVFVTWVIGWHLACTVSNAIGYFVTFKILPWGATLEETKRAGENNNLVQFAIWVLVAAALWIRL